MTDNMKKALLIITSFIFIIMSFATERKYNNSNTSDFDYYLVCKAKEISKTFGPDYDVDKSDHIVIDGPIMFESEDPRDEIQKHIGEEYYTISFMPEDSTLFDYKYIAKVAIWANGQPQRVLYGNGYGINFLFESLEKLRDNKDQIRIPLKYASKPDPQININLLK